MGGRRMSERWVGGDERKVGGRRMRERWVEGE